MKWVYSKVSIKSICVDYTKKSPQPKNGPYVCPLISTVVWGFSTKCADTDEQKWLPTQYAKNLTG